MNPVTITEAAQHHIQKMLQKNPAGIGFRLSVKTTGCSGLAYVPSIIEVKNPDDLEFNVAPELTFYLDPKALQFIDNLIIDYVVENNQVLKQEHLVFINPKEKSRCGCGESFTVE
jgi:iron-sulfur cluster assembly protein